MPLKAEQILSTPPQKQHIWQLGRHLPFSSFSTRFIDAPARVTAYIDAFRQLHPHRLVAVEDLTLSGGHEPAIVPQLADSAYRQPHLMGGLGSVRRQHLRDIILLGARRSLCSWTACHPLGHHTPTTASEVLEGNAAIPSCSLYLLLLCWSSHTAKRCLI